MSEFETDKYCDDVFLGILQKEEKIDKFLDCVFNFLHRRTDFLIVQEKPELPYGFPPNVAKQMVQQIFLKYDSIPKETLKKKLFETNENLTKRETKVDKKEISSIKSKLLDFYYFKFANYLSTYKIHTSDDAKLKDPNLDLKSKQELFQKDPASYNGAKRENYSWTQSIKDIDVRVKIKTDIKSSKDVRVKIEKESISVEIKENNNGQITWKSLLSDRLTWKVKPEDSTWSIFPGDHIHISLEKVQERWWEKLVEHEENIDLKNIHPEKPMEDLGEEEQAKIKQMMYDDQQKKMGRPTSEEQKNLEILKEAWNAEGSPFKGKPFDPSVLKMN